MRFYADATIESTDSIHNMHFVDIVAICFIGYSFSIQIVRIKFMNMFPPLVVGGYLCKATVGFKENLGCLWTV